MVVSIKESGDSGKYDVRRWKVRRRQDKLFLVPACVAVAGGGNGQSPERGVDSGASVVSGRSDRQVPQPIIVHRVGAIGYHLARASKEHLMLQEGHFLTTHSVGLFLQQVCMPACPCVCERHGANMCHPPQAHLIGWRHISLDCSLVLQPYATFSFCPHSSLRPPTHHNDNSLQSTAAEHTSPILVFHVAAD